VLHRLALATTANVNVDPGDFKPQQVGININDSVKWIWVSNFHNTVSDTALWASPVQNNGATFIHTFTAVGTFPYKCTVHGFGGIVTVQAAAAPPSVLSGPRFIPPSTFQFSYSAGSGLSYVVQRSPNLSNWVSLKTNIASGTICALLAGAYELTLARSLVLAFFLTLVLGLGESVSIQSMSVTIQALRAIRPSLAWFLKSLRREVGTALLLGVACGLVVGLIVWVWQSAPLAATVIGGSIFLTLCAACFFGLAIPSLLHWLRLDPKIAAGPITLALTAPAAIPVSLLISGGLAFAIPLCVLTANPRIGPALMHIGVGRLPEETLPSPLDAIGLPALERLDRKPGPPAAEASPCSIG